MLVHRWLVPRVVWPLAERVGGRRMLTELRRLRELQWRHPEEIERRTLLQLRALLTHAGRHVPYYRALFARTGMTPNDVRDLSALARLPVTSKADLRAVFPDGVLADNLPARRRQPMLTSGSTGLPFPFFWDRAASDVLLGTYLFALEWARVGIWDPRLTIAVPAYFATNAVAESALRRVGRRVLLGQRGLNLASDRVTTETLRQAVEHIARRGRYFIRGYPAAIARLARQLLEERAPAPGAPAVVMTYSETLTQADATSIREGFGCEVVNYYASWDVPQMAQTCPDNRDVLHVNSGRVVLRVVRADGSTAAPGESGRVVVTDLANQVMPLINYAIGDHAVVGTECPCGRGLPTLASIEGRDTEVIRTPDGRRINATFLGHFLAFVVGVIPYVWEYQLAQAAVDSVTLRVVPTPRFTAEFEKKLATELGALLGPGVAVEVEAVARIPVESSGKRLIIKSALSSPAGGAVAHPPRG